MGPLQPRSLESFPSHVCCFLVGLTGMGQRSPMGSTFVPEFTQSVKLVMALVNDLACSQWPPTPNWRLGEWPLLERKLAVWDTNNLSCRYMANSPPNVWLQSEVWTKFFFVLSPRVATMCLVVIVHFSQYIYINSSEQHSGCFWPSHIPEPKRPEASCPWSLLPSASYLLFSPYKSYALDQ